jgi:hypothetical protein
MTEHEHSLPSPALVQHHLHGMHYPATRDDLINYARSQCEGGDHPDSECERVVQILSQLPDREYQRPPDVSKAFGELARNYLERASYPAGRDDLVASVREQGADDVVLDTIIMIPSQEYRNPDAVIVEIETSVLGATLASPMRTIALPSGGPDPGLRTGRRRGRSPSGRGSKTAHERLTWGFPAASPSDPARAGTRQTAGTAAARDGITGRQPIGRGPG